MNIFSEPSCVYSLPGPAGAEGSSGARAILVWPKTFAVRALTRVLTPPNALGLWNFAARVEKGDLNEEVSIDTALKGALKDLCGDQLLGPSQPRDQEKEVC